MAAPLPGDLDGDGDVDQNDLSILMEDLNTPASGPEDPRDLDGDGTITGLDARKLVTLCTLPGCAIPPKVSITAPPNSSVFNASPIIVTGEHIDVVETVTVNGVAATLDGLTWSVTIPLVEGSNPILAVGRDESGNEGVAGIQVVLDATPPTIAITSPAQGETVADGQPSITLDYADENGVDTVSLQLIFDVFSVTTSEFGGSVNVQFEPNAANTPVTLLVKGDATMGSSSAVTLSGQAGTAGSAGAVGDGSLRPGAGGALRAKGRVARAIADHLRATCARPALC